MVHAATHTLILGLLAAMLIGSQAMAEANSSAFRFYEHPGVQRDLQQSRAPQLGAAHTISLSSELHTEFSDAQIELIRRHGPWLTHDGISHNAQVLIRTIQDARVHGLNPETYELSSILLTVDALSHLDDMQKKTADKQAPNDIGGVNTLRYKLSELLDSNFIKLAEHLGQGVVNGRELQSRLYRDAPRINAFNLLVSINNAELSTKEALSQVIPGHPSYGRLTQTMRDLLTEQSTGVQRTYVATSNAAQLISEAADKQTIRERLLETGDLTFDAYMATNADAELLRALRAFQKRHGLEESSFANEKTRLALNATVEEDIEAVALSLERWRWLPRDFGERHIFVNIPDYRVNLIDNGITTLSMPAVVGKYKHQTPSFSRNMSYMEFNPTWTVPAKIANKELIPKERRKPGYLASRNFDFLKRVGNRLIKVPASSVSRDDFNATWFPYVLQQRGGSMNALGRMKFMMPNQYAIYLHDTQAKKHFTLNDRAYSHGCIRLGDPDTLAQQLMSADGYSQQKIDESMSSKITHRVRFRKPLPTHLVYLTTWVDENGNLQKRPDIYRNDNKLLHALINNATLLSQPVDLSVDNSDINDINRQGS
ncbi:MAG: murein L,D-transpeptidase [Granulosicoccus sp.]